MNLFRQFFIFSLLNLCIFSRVHALDFKKLKPLNLEQFGFTKTSKSHEEVIYKWGKNNSIILTYSKEGKLLKVQKMGKGKLLEETRFYSDFWKTIFHDKNKKEKFSWVLPNGRVFQSHTDGKVTIHSQSYLFNQACQLPAAPANWEELINDLSWLNLSSSNEASLLTDFGVTDVHNIGNNIELQNCSSYPDNGINQIVDDLQEAIQRGISCLNRIGGDAQYEAARLLAIFRPDYGRTLKITCGVPGSMAFRGNHWRHRISNEFLAAASLPSDSFYPAVMVNLRGMEGVSRDERVITLFHELVHLNDHDHGNSFDFTYAVELCCFSPTNPDVMPRAPSAEQLSQARGILCQDLTRFRQLTRRDYDQHVLNMGRPDLMLYASSASFAGLWDRIFYDDSGLLRPNPSRQSIQDLLADSSYALSELESLDLGNYIRRDIFPPYVAMIYTIASLSQQSEEVMRLSYQEIHRRFMNVDFREGSEESESRRFYVQKMGLILGYLIEADTQNASRVWSELLENRSQVCRHMDEAMASEIFGLTRVTYDRIQQLDPHRRHLPASMHGIWRDFCHVNAEYGLFDAIPVN